MAQQRLALWNAEDDDVEEDVELLTIGNYGQSIQYEDGELFLFFLYEELKVMEQKFQHTFINLRSTSRHS